MYVLFMEFNTKHFCSLCPTKKVFKFWIEIKATHFVHSKLPLYANKNSVRSTELSLSHSAPPWKQVTIALVVYDRRERVCGSRFKTTVNERTAEVRMKKTPKGNII